MSELASAINSPVDYTELPLKVGWKIMETDEHGATIEFKLSVPAQNLHVDESRHFSLEFVGVAHDPQGKVKSFAQTVQGTLFPETRYPVDYSNQLQLTLGHFTVRLVARDNESGKMGTGTLQVTVANQRRDATTPAENR